jgi:hypothetical protein
LVLKEQEDYERLTVGDVAPGDVILGELVLNDGRKRLHEVSFPWAMGRFIVADEEARVVLAPLLEEDGYWVPILTDVNGGPRYSGFVCTRRLQALAEGAEVSRLPSGTVMNIRRLELRDDVVENAAAFSLTEWPRGPVYFSKSVADAAVAAGLTGLKWLNVWSNETGLPATERRLFDW